MAKKKDSAPAVAPELTPTPATQEEAGAETQKVKFLRSHPNYAYWPGDEADLTAEHVELLTEGGFAKLHTAETEE